MITKLMNRPEPVNNLMSDEDRKKIIEWQARNIWNTPVLSEIDHPDQKEQYYYGA